MSIHEQATAKGPEIRFLHQLAKGPANKSYGIHVGRLAGLPTSVTKRAAAILKKLEAGNGVRNVNQMSLLALLDNRQTGPQTETETETETVHRPETPAAVLELKSLDISKLTPLDALNAIARWQQSLS